MGKSVTEKNREFNKAQTTFSEFGVKYVKTWTKKELKKYLTQPIVIPYGDYGFFVGPYEINGINKECWRVTQKDGKIIGDFYNKAAAIAYCMCNVDQKYSKAEEIYFIDSMLGKLSNDLLFYENSLQHSEKSKNKLKEYITLNRYTEAKFKRKEFLNLLKKTLISAKYMKFGKQPL